MRIGIMGGTFNPPHMGHINAARAAWKGAELDRIIFVPAKIPPHKPIAEGSATVRERFEMTALAAAIVDAEVSDIEISREGKSYTVETLRELKKIYPDDELWLIMGTDMFLSIETWFEAEKVLKLASIAVVPRKESDIDALRKQGGYLLKKYGTVSRIIETETVTISSSELRLDISADEFSEFLPKEVREYIIRKNLYGISEGDKF